MKVTNKLIVALALAVPLSPISLITADELLIKDDIKAYSQGTEDHSLNTQKPVKVLPLGFEDIVIVPPNLDNVVRIESIVTSNDRPGIRADVAFNLD